MKFRLFLPLLLAFSVLFVGCGSVEFKNLQEQVTDEEVWPKGNSVEI